jgi:hypothetical protein
MFLAENEFAYARMKPICSNEEIKFPHASVFEGNQNAGSSCLVNALDTVAKYRFNPAFNFAEDCLRQVRTRLPSWTARSATVERGRRSSHQIPYW